MLAWVQQGKQSEPRVGTGFKSGVVEFGSRIFSASSGGSGGSGDSVYQAEWILDDSNVSGSYRDEDGMVIAAVEYSGQGDGGKVEPADDQASLNLRDSDEETEVESIMMDNGNLIKEQMEEKPRQIKEAHAVDKDFTDAMDVSVDVPAQKRFPQLFMIDGVSLVVGQINEGDYKRLVQVIINGDYGVFEELMSRKLPPPEPPDLQIETTCTFMEASLEDKTLFEGVSNDRKWIV